MDYDGSKKTYIKGQYIIVHYWKNIYNNDRHQKWVTNWGNITTKIIGRWEASNNLEFDDFGQNYGPSFNPISGLLTVIPSACPLLKLFLCCTSWS